MHLHPPETDVASPPLGAEDVTATADHKGRRRLVWAGAVLLLFAVLGFALPLVSANQYRGKIAESMSKSLGRPVHLDNVSLHLLPVPGFTLQNLVVSEDPAFGAEPTIRANKVEATLRVSSLWRRPVEFSTVRFVEPSVNLVRNAQGRWNLSDVLLNASHVQSAPTAQRKAGPKPRFPYIEATGGRVNIKFGEEKLPFSLTDADFALWLPSSQQWRVRLIGHPARTDTNITDPGRLRIEGNLQHAASAAEIPVDFRASWHDAPLGEATRILTGDDRGWRGSLNLDATLTGTLGDAKVASKLTLGGLRRADFFPAHPLDLQVTCGSGFTLHPVTLSRLVCSLPDDAKQPLTFGAESVHPQSLRDTDVSIDGDEIPVRWGLLWAALFSPRVAADRAAGGTLNIHLRRGLSLPAETTAPVSKPTVRARASGQALQAAQGDHWAGTVEVTLPQPSSLAKSDEPAHNALILNTETSDANAFWPTLRLASASLVLGPDAAVNVTGSIGAAGYTFGVNGEAPVAALLQPSRVLPQMADGFDAVLPTPSTADAEVPVRLQFTCARTWGAVQVCSPSPSATQSGKAAGAGTRTRHRSR